MSQYIEPIKTAVLFFPFVALLFTMPYMLVQYRKYGAILLMRTAVIYSFILYLMCAYFLTILPLPDWDFVAGLTSPTIQLIPLREVVDLFRHSAVEWSNPATYYRLFTGHDFFQIVANVAMTIPFGIYLRYYFGCGFKKTVMLTLGLSLVFELTQLSGLFGLYPRPYRLADVDDLMTNTLGGMVGYWAAPLVIKLLPSKERMDEVAYRRGTHVSVTRRAFAAMLDGCVLLVLMAVLLWLAPGLMPSTNDIGGVLLWFFECYTAGIALYFMLGEWLLKGRTVGKRLLHLRLTDIRDGGRPKLWQCVVRYTVLYLVVLPTPMVILLVLTLGGLDGGALVWSVLICIVLLLVYVLFWLLMAVQVFTHSIQLLHGKLSMTRNVSTLRAKQVRTGTETDASGIKSTNG